MRYKILTYVHNLGTILILFILLVFAWVFNNSTGWGIFYTFLFFIILSAFQLLGWLNLIKIKFQKRYLSAWNLNETLNFSLSARHFLFFAKLQVQCFQNHEIIGIGRISNHNFKHKVDYQIVLAPLDRGIYRDQVMLFLASDYFYIWEKSKVKKVHLNLIVLPHDFKEEGHNLKQIIKKLVITPDQQINIDSFEFKKYRDYQSSDGIKKIDWKKTAKADRLIVRENYPEVKRDNILIFWGQRSRGSEEFLAYFYSMYKILNKNLFSYVYLIGEDNFYGKKIVPEWLASFKFFTESPDLDRLSKLHHHNIYFFSGISADQYKSKISFLESHNNLAYLEVTENTSLKFTSKNRSKTFYFGVKS